MNLQPPLFSQHGGCFDAYVYISDKTGRGLTVTFSHKEKSKTFIFYYASCKNIKIYIRKNDNTVSFITLPS